MADFPADRPPLRAVAPRESVMNLRCPHCGEEALFIGVPHFDQMVGCDRCGNEAEVRRAHEAWCAKRRGCLEQRFPDLHEPIKEIGSDAGEL